jgi:hypothetical protein
VTPLRHGAHGSKASQSRHLRARRASRCMTASSVFMIGETSHFWERKVEYTAPFKDVQGLKPGAPVRLGGVDIGTVSGVGYDKQASDARIFVKLARRQERSGAHPSGIHRAHREQGSPRRQDGRGDGTQPVRAAPPFRRRASERRGDRHHDASEQHDGASEADARQHRERHARLRRSALQRRHPRERGGLCMSS